ncbi:MAG: cytochrome c oxidase subunit II transmembrane domain-containing protein, partial [Gemmatimonadales bacterium]
MHWWFPENASSYGSEIDRLFLIILYITGIVFVLTEAALLWFLFKYRRRDGQKASYIEGSTKAEVIWTTVPAVIVIFLG